MWNLNGTRKKQPKILGNMGFHEAATVFGDSLAITFDDSEHSIGEHRLLTFGITRTGKLARVSHTEQKNANHQHTSNDKAREKDL